MDKRGTGALNPGDRTKPSAFPEPLAPQTIEPFGHTIAFGFTEGNENQFDAEIQGETYKRTEHPWYFPIAIEGGIIIQLQAIGQPQLLARIEQCHSSPVR